MSSPKREPDWQRLALGDHLLAESPRWVSATHTLGWVDILAGTLSEATWTPTTQWSKPRVRELGGQPTSLEASRAAPGGWDVVHDGRLFMLPSLEASVHGAGIQLLEPKSGVRTNDTTRDPAGRMLVGLFTEDRETPRGGVLSVTEDGEARLVVSGLVTANGLGIDPVGNHLFVVDTARGLLLRYPYDTDSGDVGEAVLIVHHPGPGKLDGLLLRPDGTLLVAVWGEGVLHRYNAQGRLLETITAPSSRPTALAAVDTDGPHLLVTTARDDLGSTPSPELRAVPGDDGALHLTEEAW